MRQVWIEAAGRYYGCQQYNTNIKIQTKLYNKFIKIPEDKREEAMSLGRSWWNTKAVKGPAVDW